MVYGKYDDTTRDCRQPSNLMGNSASFQAMPELGSVDNEEDGVGAPRLCA
jgi:hypothetical protein